MKRLSLRAVILLSLFLLSACASTQGAAENAPRVKCPACGYEFTAPPHGR
ncbi:hypothetical protein [Trichloromonas acetexigens]|jgi:uncharacterized lipoprotein YajG|nr:hypothetical protein [Desulfuromonas acetexigens]